MRIRERFNPRAPCGARRQRPTRRLRQRSISTHAPLAGRDGKDRACGRGICISTHAPLAGRDRNVRILFRGISVFQPTRPLRGATVNTPPWQNCDVFQPTRPLRGATACRQGVGRHVDISTHAPLAGRDFCSRAITSGQKHFNPRAPCGARPGGLTPDSCHTSISTHAPLAGRDAEGFIQQGNKALFQPTRPLRGATLWGTKLTSTTIFQPTRPLRGATEPKTVTASRLAFQPTRPLRGAT